MMNGNMGSRVIKEISDARLSESEKEKMEKELKNIDGENLPESEKEELRRKVKGKNLISKVVVDKLRVEVKKVMWKYYSENKHLLPDYVGEFREEIIVELMKGESVEDVFDSYGGGEKLLKAS